jgi:hypothetical protein
MTNEENTLSAFTLGFSYVISVATLFYTCFMNGWNGWTITAAVALVSVGTIPQLYEIMEGIACGRIEVISLLHILSGDIALVALGYASGIDKYNGWLITSGVSMIIATGASHATFLYKGEEARDKRKKVTYVTILAMVVYLSSMIVGREDTSIALWVRWLLLIIVQLYAILVHNKDRNQSKFDSSE